LGLIDKGISKNVVKNMTSTSTSIF